MDVAAIPFNHFLGLEAGPPDSDLLVSLPAAPHYANHVGTVHASALLAVAEAGSGAFLVRHLGAAAGLVPVVRRLEARFRKPARGRVSARASVAPGELERVPAEVRDRGRALVTVAVEVLDEGGIVVLTAGVEWFIARAE